MGRHSHQGLLLALDYPRATTFNLSDEQAVRKLVVWLENVKVGVCVCGGVPADRATAPASQVT